jgi:hypothetical protein
VTDRQELFERYKLAYQEYRSEVSLGWERQKLFLTLNPTLTALIPAFGRDKLAGAATLCCAAVIALAGAFIVSRAHSRYRATRLAMHALETQLGIAGVQTTGGQRELKGGPRLEAFRVVDVLVIVFMLNAALDFLLAGLWSRS